MLHSQTTGPIANDTADQEIFNRMKCYFASLNDDELEAIEDDLNFCRFTGMPSDRLRRLMDRIETLSAATSDRPAGTVAA